MNTGNQGRLPLSDASSSSGSQAFDTLRNALANNSGLKGEVERALHVNVSRVNPSDGGNRFVTGGAAEWIVAAAAWHVGILTVPGGHSEKGFDLLDLQSAARGLWSVKSQTTPVGGEFRISNGMGGSGKGLSTPTVFLAPKLPGLVFVDPAIHAEIAAKARPVGDAVVLAFGAVKTHAAQHPECVAPLAVAQNEGRGRENPFLAYTKTILVPEQFPLLSEMFVAATPAKKSVSDEVQQLAEMRDAGTITPEQFDDLLRGL